MGRRARCPVCGSSDGLGTTPDDTTRWYCYSSKHDAGGSALDYHFALREGRHPDRHEAVAEARHVLGLGANGPDGGTT